MIGEGPGSRDDGDVARRTSGPECVRGQRRRLQVRRLQSEDVRRRDVLEFTGLGCDVGR